MDRGNLALRCTLLSLLLCISGIESVPGKVVLPPDSPRGLLLPCCLREVQCRSESQADNWLLDRLGYLQPHGCPDITVESRALLGRS